MARIAGIDVGGTNIEGAVVGDDHAVGARHKVTTPTGGPGDVVRALVEVLHGLDEEVTAVGLGIPGVVSDGTLSTPPNLANFPPDVPIQRMVAEATGLPVAVGNDVSVAVLGESVAGAGRGSAHVLGVWLGTGVGGGLVLDGRPYTGPTGAAGEFGHMVVRAGGAQCGCGRRGCIEAYAGRLNMERFVQRAVDSGAFTTALWDIMRAQGKDRATSRVWQEALDEGDGLVTRVFDEAMEAVGIGVAAVINLVDVDRVIIGGGLAEKMGQELADRIRDEAAPYAFPGIDGRSFVVAELQDDAGIVGAAEMCRSRPTPS